jgi:hypothetical protein
MGLNEPDPIQWTDQARAHYRIDVGGPGDGRYLRGFHGRENLDRPFRWSLGTSTLLLPVPVGKACTLTIEANLPTPALGPDAGIYLGDQKLADLPAEGPITAEIPAQTVDHVRLELRCHGWVPQDTNPGSKDPRTLGLQVFTITVKAAEAGSKVFSANRGEWLGP